MKIETCLQGLLELDHSVNLQCNRDGALVKWLWKTTRDQEVVGSSLHTGLLFTLVCCKNCHVCLKIGKITKKTPGMAYFFKKNLQGIVHIDDITRIHILLHE